MAEIRGQIADVTAELESIDLPEDWWFTVDVVTKSVVFIGLHELDDEVDREVVLWKSDGLWNLSGDKPSESLADLIGIVLDRIRRSRS